MINNALRCSPVINNAEAALWHQRPHCTPAPCLPDTVRGRLALERLNTRVELPAPGAEQR